LNPRTRQEQPVTKGRIRFYCGNDIYSGDIVGGHFEISDLPAGEARIAIENPLTEPPAAGKKTPPTVDIPPEYNHVGTTPLVWIVTAGKQEIKISLHSGKVAEQSATNP
jgi:hypothetical protein